MIRVHLSVVSAAVILGLSGAAMAADFTEGFDGIAITPASDRVPAGWSQVNNSDPVAALGWFPLTGFTTPPPTHAGANAIVANFQAGAGVSDLSLWLITPVMTWNNGDTISFWTRSLNPVDGGFADRLQVRLSSNGGIDVGTTSTSVGDFSNLLLDINPDLLISGATAYPTDYTQFSITVSGLSGGSASGALSFRYFVPGGGPSGDNSNAIILDSLVVTGIPAPSAAAMLGLAGLAAARRRRSK